MRGLASSGLRCGCGCREGVGASWSWQALQGKEIDLEGYGRLTDRLGRAFHRLGLKRQQRTVEPSLADILNEEAAE
jgi:hypothetical protein